MTLEPYQGILIKNSRYVSTGEHPLFALRSSRRRSPRGWSVVSFRADVWKGTLTPVLSIDDEENIPVTSPSGGARKITCVVRLPDSVHTIRLEPMSGPGEFDISDFRINEIGHIQLSILLLWPRMKSIFFNPDKLYQLFLKGLSIWRRDGIAGIKHVLMNSTQITTQDNYGGWVQRYNTLSDGDRQAIRKHIEALPYQPLFSIVMPVYNTNERLLRMAIESVGRQLYQNWELCIADDGSTFPHIERVLKEYWDKDPRIKVVFRKTNGHISAASNSALGLAVGEFIALLDHDDELAEHALYMVAVEINQYPDANIIYSDEDKIDENGNRISPYFKSDWNPDLFFGHNMISHLGVYRADAITKIGGFREGVEGSQDYDLALRVIEISTASQIRHIPYVLYHWRMIPGSVAFGVREKAYAYEAARQAFRDYFNRMDIQATVTTGKTKYLHRIVYPVSNPAPRVSVIIPTRDRVDLLKRCVTGILKRTDYKNIEIIVIDNQSADRSALDYLNDIQKNENVYVLSYNGTFNYSKINNVGIAHSTGEVVCLLNNDTEIINADWLTEMVGHALRPEIGIVGAKLYYPNNTIQHAGVILGVGGVAGHTFTAQPRTTYGYMSKAILTQNLSAVTGACMVFRRKVYEEVEGLDEGLPIAYNDIDYCLRVRERGYRILWTPYAELYHHDSASRGLDEKGRNAERLKNDAAYMQKKWGDKLLCDPYYNPNLTLDKTDYSLAFPPRNVKPWADHTDAKCGVIESA